jgi:hypothetical protein
LEKVGYPDAPGAGRSVSPELKDRQEALMRQAIDRHLLEGVPPVEAESGGEAMRMGPEFAEMMKLQLEAFRQKFGREPEPDEPIFFDEDADYPTPTPAIPREEFARAMLAGGIRPVVAYSFWKTGFIVNEVGYDNMSDQDRDELEDAGNEWLALSDAQQQRWLIDIKGS